jgi:tetratricopeptide (TPR) repeat protein
MGVRPCQSLLDHLNQEAGVAGGMLKTVLVGLVCLLAAVSRADMPATPDEIARAVQQLGATDFQTRQRASAFLWSAGRAAEAAVRQALASKDLEVVRRARELNDKFKWGIYPDTPPDLVELIRLYRGGDDAGKRQAVDRLMDHGAGGLVAVMKIASAEEEPGRRLLLRRQVGRETARTGADLLAARNFAELERFLELALAVETEDAFRNYAAYWLFRGRLDEKIADVQKRFDHSGGKQAAELLAYLDWAKGDQDGARRAAEKTGKPDLLRGILVEQGRWAEVLAQHRGAGATRSSDLEYLGFLATYQRLAGDAKGLEDTLGKIHTSAAGAWQSGDVWAMAKPFFLNDRPREGIEALLEHKELDAAFDLLCAQLRFREAFALADKARAEKSSRTLAIDIQRARLLWGLGEQDAAKKLFTDVAEQIKDAKDFHLHFSLIEAMTRVGWKDAAYAHCGRLLARHRDGILTRGFWHCLFPKNSREAQLWWKVLRQKFSQELMPATLGRLERLLDGKYPAEELDALLDKTDRSSLHLNRVEMEEWLAALAEAYEAAGRDTRARGYLNVAIELQHSPEAFVRLGDFLARKQQWADAADRYGDAWDKNRRDPLPLYLRGWALARSGQKAEGQKLMDLAHGLPLANESARAQFASALAGHGLAEAAQREYGLILRTGPVDSQAGNRARRQLARSAHAKRDFMRAAALDERAMIECLRADLMFEKKEAFLAVPHLIHRFRAQGFVSAGRFQEADREIQRALAALPAEIELVIALVPELEKHGHPKEAAELFARVTTVYEQLCKDYPRSSWAHNSLAWMSARCHRQLDQALQHAQQAADLAPGTAGILDTLAEVHFQRGEKDKAREIMQRCIALEGKTAYFRKQLARFEAGNPAADVPEAEE